jgi:prostamide/prostaglandin F2alpha synthase
LFQARKLGLGGDIKGDGYQNGGALVVDVGGEKTLLHFVQKEAPDHVSNAQVLKVGFVFIDYFCPLPT